MQCLRRDSKNNTRSASHRIALLDTATTSPPTTLIPPADALMMVARSLRPLFSPYEATPS